MIEDAGTFRTNERFINHSLISVIKMAQKKESGSYIEEIKDLMVAGKLIIGTDRAIKGLKDGTTGKIFIAKNTPSRVIEDMEYYSKMSGCEIIKLEINNEELGVVCKKPFLISAVSVLRE